MSFFSNLSRQVARKGEGETFRHHSRKEDISRPRIAARGQWLCSGAWEKKGRALMLSSKVARPRLAEGDARPRNSPGSGDRGGYQGRVGEGCLEIPRGKSAFQKVQCSVRNERREGRPPIFASTKNNYGGRLIEGGRKKAFKCKGEPSSLFEGGSVVKAVSREGTSLCNFKKRGCFHESHEEGKLLPAGREPTLLYSYLCLRAR